MSTELIYWDSDCFLGWFQDEAGKVELCEGTIERADQGEALIFTSALTIAEVLWLRGSPPIVAGKGRTYQEVFSSLIYSRQECHAVDFRECARPCLEPWHSPKGRNTCC